MIAYVYEYGNPFPVGQCQWKEESNERQLTRADAIAELHKAIEYEQEEE